MKNLMDLHVKVGFPRLFDASHVIAQKDDMIRAKRRAAQGHIGLRRGSVAFFVVALVASGNEVFPSIFTVATSG